MDTSASTISRTSTGFTVSHHESTVHTYHISPGLFHPTNAHIAQLYASTRKCLVFLDHNVSDIQGEGIRGYFANHGINATIRVLQITEDRKDIQMLLDICHMLADYGVLRREAVLVVGGGLVTDVVG